MIYIQDSYNIVGDLNTYFKSIDEERCLFCSDEKTCALCDNTYQKLDNYDLAMQLVNLFFLFKSSVDAKGFDDTNVMLYTTDSRHVFIALAGDLDKPNTEICKYVHMLIRLSTYDEFEIPRKFKMLKDDMPHLDMIKSVYFT